MYTYGELLEALQVLSKEDLNKTATVYVRGTGECYGVNETITTGEIGCYWSDDLNGTLDDDHPVMVI